MVKNPVRELTFAEVDCDKQCGTAGLVLLSLILAELVCDLEIEEQM
jgi:hypothetical protein